MPTKSPARTSKPSAHPVRDAADALYRAAKESCHQHERLAHILALGVDDKELAGAAAMADDCDRLLAEQAKRFESVGEAGRGTEPEEWWLAASGLWLGCRDYLRRHELNDSASSRLKRHTAAQLAELKVEYELEMSARLAIKQAITAYAAVRPEA
jgi:hypothetical protein